jgi:hypothetical protein
MTAEHPERQPLEWAVIAKELNLSSVWQRVKPDGVWRTKTGELIIAECYARVGVLKPGHRRKLALDALKLMALCRQFPPAMQLRSLIIVPRELEGQLKGEGWFCAALSMAGELLAVDLLEEERALLAEANQRQAEGQARLRKREQPGLLG